MSRKRDHDQISPSRDPSLSAVTVECDSSSTPPLVTLRDSMIQCPVTTAVLDQPKLIDIPKCSSCEAHRDMMVLMEKQKNTIDRLERQMDEIIWKEKEKQLDCMLCYNCPNMEKEGKMMVCETCTEEENDIRKVGMNMKIGEIHIQPFTICAHCCLKKHLGHVFMEYEQWEVIAALGPTLSEVSKVDGGKHNEMTEGETSLKLWKEDAESLRSVAMVCDIDCAKSIVTVLDNERKRVCQASNDCLPPLRKYTKILKESSKRIQKAKREVNEGKTLNAEDYKDRVEKEY